jgi:lysyl-tRNA synthetase class 1
MTKSCSKSPIALASSAWPFQEAEKLVRRYRNAPPAKGYVLFETGYGPSGLPHIGTFGEVVRTAMVRHAFQTVSDIPTRLITFSDDMDGLRKVPDTVPPAKRALFESLVDKPGWAGVPLTKIPDPYGNCHESYGEHNNAQLRKFLDDFGFEYEFRSSTNCYKSGQFDNTLLAVLRKYDEILEIAEKTVGPERRKNYGLFLPLIKDQDGNHRYFYVRPVEIRPESGTIVFLDPQGKRVEHPVTGGHCKLLWRIDWAMRWVALGADYEMSGKDLIDSVKLSSRVCQVLGGKPPEGFTYELFLDENAEKISKSKGNGLTVEQWLTYAPPESLSLYMFQKPRQAKRLYFDVIPRAVDEYLDWLAKYRGQDEAQRFANPVWHIHAGQPPQEDVPLSFAVLLNLVGVCNTEDKAIVWGFIRRYIPGATPQNHPLLDSLVAYALAYYRDFIVPAKRFRQPSAAERAALEELQAGFAALAPNADGEAIQSVVYAVGKNHAAAFPNLRDWFKALYEILLGQEQGPRFGSFAALYGLAETRALIARALAGENLAA